MGYYWREYVPVADRVANGKKAMEKRKKKGEVIEPVEIEGKKIAQKFWGKKWCDHLEKFADYENRLPRGRAYVKNGSVCHLAINEGIVEAVVSGSSLYQVKVSIQMLAKQRWEAIKEKCRGTVGTLLELLTGLVSDKVMAVVADEKEGLFPSPKEMNFSCSCPDWAGMCKHVAAVLYGVGHRLDRKPELLFALRGVNPQELINTQLIAAIPVAESQLDGDGLAEIFDIELETAPVKQTAEQKKVKPQTKRLKKKFILNVEQLTGKDLVTFREQKTWTVSQLADALDVTPASIYRWEKNQGKLKLQKRSQEALRLLI